VGYSGEIDHAYDSDGRIEDNSDPDHPHDTFLRAGRGRDIPIDIVATDPSHSLSWAYLASMGVTAGSRFTVYAPGGGGYWLDAVNTKLNQSAIGIGRMSDDGLLATVTMEMQSNRETVFISITETLTTATPSKNVRLSNVGLGNSTPALFVQMYQITTSLLTMYNDNLTYAVAIGLPSAYYEMSACVQNGLLAILARNLSTSQEYVYSGSATATSWGAWNVPAKKQVIAGVVTNPNLTFLGNAWRLVVYVANEGVDAEGRGYSLATAVKTFDYALRVFEAASRGGSPWQGRIVLKDSQTFVYTGGRLAENSFMISYLEIISQSEAVATAATLLFVDKGVSASDEFFRMMQEVFVMRVAIGLVGDDISHSIKIAIGNGRITFMECIIRGFLADYSVMYYTHGYWKFEGCSFTTTASYNIVLNGSTILHLGNGNTFNGATVKAINCGSIFSGLIIANTPVGGTSPLLCTVPGASVGYYSTPMVITGWTAIPATIATGMKYRITNIGVEIACEDTNVVGLLPAGGLTGIIFNMPAAYRSKVYTAALYSGNVAWRTIQLHVNQAGDVYLINGPTAVPAGQGGLNGTVFIPRV
jgi:hypothetical protein